MKASTCRPNVKHQVLSNYILVFLCVFLLYTYVDNGVLYLLRSFLTVVLTFTYLLIPFYYFYRVRFDFRYYLQQIEPRSCEC